MLIYKGNYMRKVSLFLIILLYVSLLAQNLSAERQDTIKAKIAILHKGGDEYTTLRNNDRIRAGEMLRVFVQPSNPGYVYVIHTDNKESTLLLKKQVKNKNEIIILPTENDFYVFDESSPTAKITVFCSLKKIDDIEKLFDKETKESKLWNSLEEKVIKKNKKNLSDKTDKPFPIAGNVSSVNENFLEQIQTLSGKSILIRKYEFEIKK